MKEFELEVRTALGTLLASRNSQVVVDSTRVLTAEGKSVFCKFHWKPALGTHSLMWDEAVKIAGADPDFHRRDLWEAIESGHYPEWELGLQTLRVMIQQHLRDQDAQLRIVEPLFRSLAAAAEGP